MRDGPDGKLVESENENSEPELLLLLLLLVLAVVVEEEAVMEEMKGWMKMVRGTFAVMSWVVWWCWSSWP